MKHTDGRSIVLHNPVLELKKAKWWETEKSEIPASIVVRIEKMEPVYQ